MRGKAATVRAIVLLAAARFLIAAVPFSRWSATLGLANGAAGEGASVAKRLAHQVDNGTRVSPIGTRCLPRAMALSWLLRRSGIPHEVVIAVRPENERSDGDSLHAWVESNGKILLGELPGPWIVVQTLPG